MEDKTITALIWFVCAAHALFAFVLTIEINDFPFLKKWRKFPFLILVWFVPIIGSVIAHKALSIGFGTGVGTFSSGDNIIGSYGESGGGGCDGGGGDGGC